MLKARFGHADDGTERDSRVLLVGQLGSKGRAIAEALRRTGYAIQWEAEATALRAAASELPPAALVVECDDERDPFRVLRWIRSQRTYAHVLVFAFVRESLPVGDGIAAGADDVFDSAAPIDDVLDRVAARIARARTNEERAYFDCVTQVRNRRYVVERIPGELSLALRRHGTASLAVLDVDGCDSIRRESGRVAADRALEIFGFALRSSLRSVDVACRFDDRTFVVVLPGLDATSAAIALASVGFDGRTFATQTPRLRITRAFAEAPRDGAKWEELLEVAERRLRAPRAPTASVVTEIPSREAPMR